MSSITKEWNEEDFRKELRRLDQYVKRSQGIDLVGGELDIEYSERARCTLGMYYPKEKKFKFSLLFFNSDVPEACAIDVIRHEYAHYYADVVMGYSHGHGSLFKTACRIVGANPSTYYSKTFEASARKKEEWDARTYDSAVKEGQLVLHPQFGEGNVLLINKLRDTALLKIDFGKYGIRIIDETWLKNNGVV